MKPTTAEEYRNRLRGLQATFAKKYGTVRKKRCLMIMCNTEKLSEYYETLRLLNSFDARDFDEGDFTWDFMSTDLIYSLLLNLEKKLC